MLRRRRILPCTLSALIALAALQGPLKAQPTFDSGSTGSDGALELSTPGIVVFDPAAFSPVLDADGDGIYHFTTITIAAGVTVRLQADKMGTRPVVWLAQGDVEIAGTLDLNGSAGYMHTLPVQPVPAAGGFSGGYGNTAVSTATPGQGPGGGRTATTNITQTNLAFGSGAGHLGNGGASNAGIGGGPPYGTSFVQPLVGGSGGGGGGFSFAGGACFGGGGGSGGGAILLASSTRVLLSGAIQAKGGNGTDGTIGCGGGGGSGGAVRIVTKTIEGNGTITTTGGIAASGTPGAGSVGRVRLEAVHHLFAGSTVPGAVYSSPNAVLPPAGGPRVRVVSVDGVALPPNPGGSYPLADVVVDESGPVTFAIEAENIPLGTLVQLMMFSEAHVTAVIDSTPLAGTLASSTATATATLPSGVSRFTVQANWTP